MTSVFCVADGKSPLSESDSDWRPFQKGGPFQPYFSPSHLLVDWRNDGAALKESALQRVGTTAQVMQSSSLWGRAGLTYAHVSSVGFGVRVLPAGEIFSTESISIFSEDEDRLPLLAMLNSTVVAEVLQVFGRGRKFENGSVKALPIDRTDVAAANELTATAEALVRAIWSIESIDETSSIFVSPYALATSTSPEKYSSCIKELAAEAQDLQAKVDDVAAGVLGVSEPIDVSIARRPELLKRTIEDGRVGLEQWAGASFSYLVGVAFGRWHADYALGDSYGNPGANLFDADLAVATGHAAQRREFGRRRGAESTCRRAGSFWMSMVTTGTS